jgi:hypothetical protein
MPCWMATRARWQRDRMRIERIFRIYLKTPLQKAFFYRKERKDHKEIE